MKQSIPLKSILNARELGGYRSDDGRMVRKGVLLRTACLAGIADEDIRTLLEDFRLGDIVDFRMKMELAGAEDPPMEGVRYTHLDVIDISGYPEMSQELQVNLSDIVSMLELTEKMGMLNEKMYIGFLNEEMGRKAFSGFFRILLAAPPDRAVLWHCTSGKDRTGLAAMLLLSALGVDEPVMMEDYLLTNEYNARRIAGTRQAMKSRGYDDAFAEKATLLLDGVDESFMRNALVFLKRQFGSVTGYLRDALELSEDDILALKEKYLA